MEAAEALLDLWDFSDPEVSESRFREALKSADSNSSIVLWTQIARTFGMRREFKECRRILEQVEASLEAAGSAAKAHYFLELGRSFVSATHPADDLSDAARQSARRAYLRALELARQTGLDHLAIDALHMMAFVETAPEQQLAWNRKALDTMLASEQKRARGWEASLRNNLGYALHLCGDNAAALEQFELALEACERQADPAKIRVAQWMVAWCLRLLGRHQEALPIQLQLEEACQEVGQPDPYVFEELEQLYLVLDQPKLAQTYAEKRAALEPQD